MATDNHNNTNENRDDVIHSPRIEIENRSQELHRELSLSEITTIGLRNWPLFLVLFIISSAIGLAFYTWKNPFVAKTTIIINDSQNSQLQAFSSVLAGNVKTNEAKKTNSDVQKQLEYFKTTGYFQKIIDAAEASKKSNELTLSEKAGQDLFFKLVLNDKSSLTEDEKNKAYQILDQMLSYKVKSDFEIETSASDDKKELALFVVNLSTQVALQALKENESTEIQKLSEKLSTEKSNIDLEITQLNAKMSKFNDKPENFMSLTSADKIGEYLSTLKIEKNSVVMKLAENNKLIQTLTVNTHGRRESELYGNKGRIQMLKLENEQLRSKLSNLQAAFDRTSSEAKVMPQAAQIYEELKKSSEQLFERLKVLNADLTKIDALKFAAANKYELLEKARLDKVAPEVSRKVIFFLALLMSQVLGSVIIYLRAIWNSNVITAESTRNVVVLDSHSLDPRVIIENSKIRFRLRHSSLEDDVHDHMQDQEQGHTKKLGFNFKAKDQNG